MTLGTLAIGLYYQGSDVPISEPGTYTLMTAATMSVDTNKLSVADAVPGFDYVFEESGGVLTLTLTDTGAGGGGTVWASPESGAWETGPNWNPATPPDGATALAKLGSVLTNNATVTLGAPFTVGALEINNLFWSYTLEGAPLTFGAPARIDMLGGSHTIANTLDAGGPLGVTTGSGTLTFGGTGGVLAPVALEQGALTLADSATLAGGVSVAEGASLTVSGADTTVGTSLDGGPGAALTLGANSKLTLDQTQGGGLTGVVQGPATAQIIRGGPGTWTLTGEPGSSYEGSFLQGGAGETVLSGLPMTGGVAAEAGGALTFAPAVTNGLMGYYYYLGNQGNVQALTNAFKSVAGFDAALATRSPDLIWQSCTASENFDYPLTEGPTLSFPYPFGGNGVSAGPYQYFFVAAWRGSITVPETGLYSFGVNADDYALLAIDGELIYSAVAYVGGIFYRTVQLTEGRHDILVGLGQLSGNGGIRLWVRAPSESAHILLPNSWLAPMVPVGALNSAGGVTVQGGANVSVGTSGPGVLSGALNIGADGVLEKAGASVLDLRGGPNMVEGDVNVRNGTLALRAPDQLGPSGRLTVRETGVVSLLAPQTVGALSGKGPVLFGSGSIDVIPFTGDGDCEISPAKTYSHLLDFPTSKPPATVNNVTFGADAGHSFSANLTSMDPDDNATGIARLLSGFCYNVADYTLTLTGLQPFTAYEVRLYFKMWGNGNADRNVTFTFTAGANAVGSETHNIDFASTPYHFLRCNYATDENGSLDIRLFSNNGGTTCHLYALSNEFLGDAMGDLALTVAAPAGTDALYGGAFTGSGALVKDGPGTQRFSGANNLSGGLAVLDGEATLMPGATVAGIAEVGAGAALSAPFGNVTLGGLSGDGLFSTGLQNGNYPYPANVPYQHFFTDDATSQISPLKRYTHKLDFGIRDDIPSGVPGATVNGVTFTKADINGSENGYGWSTIGNQRHAGNASADVTGDVHALLTDMVYGRQNNPA
ncbi:MAG: PA14 domain-containing protein, partial [Kiritimatiellaeota bacterium]|nr:PA14 domain-containing protein [Kiritimatiellota bacterium]